MRTAYLAEMNEMRIDALVFPTATYPPKLNGDRNTTPAGTLSGIASALHWPGVVGVGDGRAGPLLLASLTSGAASPPPTWCATRHPSSTKECARSETSERRDRLSGQTDKQQSGARPVWRLWSRCRS